MTSMTLLKFLTFMVVEITDVSNKEQLNYFCDKVGR